MSEMEEAFKEIKVCKDIVQQGIVPQYGEAGKGLLKGLDSLKDLLKTPSTANINQAINLIEIGESWLATYRYIGSVADLLKHLARLREHLTKAKEKK